MFHFDPATVGLFYFFGFLILAPLAVCGIFAISEYFSDRTRRKKGSRRAPS